MNTKVCFVFSVFLVFFAFFVESQKVPRRDQKIVTFAINWIIDNKLKKATSSLEVHIVGNRTEKTCLDDMATDIIKGREDKGLRVFKTSLGELAGK